MKKIEVARIVLIVMYLFTSMINLSLALNQPQVIGGLADTALLPGMGELIHSMPIWVFRLGLFAFAAYQILLVSLLLSKGFFVQLGMLGAIAFHVGILPFGLFNLINIVFIVPLLYLVDQYYDRSIPGMLLALIMRKENVQTVK